MTRLDLDDIDRAADVYVPGEQIRALVRCVRSRLAVLGAERAVDMACAIDAGKWDSAAQLDHALHAESETLREYGLLP